MANKTNASDYYWGVEYYYGYDEPVIVDETTLESDKYSILISFWVGLAAFVLFLFLILLYMSISGSSPKNFSPISSEKLNGSIRISKM